MVNNPKRVAHTRITYDGCVIKHSLTADFVIRCPEGDIVIELKGSDVDHGAQQIIATARHFTKNAASCAKIAGIIIARQYPKITTTIQKAKRAFAREFKGPLHVSTRNGAYDACRVLDFQGPH